MILPRGMAEPAELQARIDSLVPSLPPGIVNLRYSVDDDWSGDPAISFYITISDDAAREDVIGQTGRRIRDFIWERLDPMRQWGLIPYVNLRSQSDQAELQDARFG